MLMLKLLAEQSGKLNSDSTQLLGTRGETGVLFFRDGLRRPGR